MRKRCSFNFLGASFKKIKNKEHVIQKFKKINDMQSYRGKGVFFNFRGASFKKVKNKDAKIKKG